MSMFIVQKLIREQNLAKNQKLASARYVWTIPVVARSKAWVCGRSLAGIVGSNPAGGMDVSLVSVVSCTGNGLCDGQIHRPEESYRV